MKLTLATLVKNRRDYLESLDKNGFDFKALLVGLYVDNLHFLYELIQNAEDAEATWIHFELAEDCLRVRHNGEKKFTVQDIDAITGISNLHNRPVTV